MPPLMGWVEAVTPRPIYCKYGFPTVRTTQLGKQLISYALVLVISTRGTSTNSRAEIVFILFY